MISGLWEAALWDGSWFKIILMSLPPSCCGSWLAVLDPTSSPGFEGSVGSEDTETPRRENPSVNDN